MTALAKEVGGSIILNHDHRAFLQFSSVQDALRYAKTLQVRVVRHNVNQNNQNLRLALTVSVDSGEIAAGPDGNILGGSMIRVHKISSFCPPGRIYVTDFAKAALWGVEFQFSLVGEFQLSVHNKKEAIYDLPSDDGEPVRPNRALNPFVWRGGITEAEDFFKRVEQETILDHMRQGKNVQIVGETRVGKTSLLRQIARLTPTRLGPYSVTAYLDLRTSNCTTVDGWLAQVAQKLHLASVPRKITDLPRAVLDKFPLGFRPVLLLDNYEVLIRRSLEFTGDFFRGLAQSGILLITAINSQMLGSESPNLPSDLDNSFETIRLPNFTDSEVEQFLKIERKGTPRFDAHERNLIKNHCKGHPLALQVFSFYIIEAKLNGWTTEEAKRRADSDLATFLRSWNHVQV